MSKLVVPENQQNNILSTAGLINVGMEFETDVLAPQWKASSLFLDLLKADSVMNSRALVTEKNGMHMATKFLLRRESKFKSLFFRRLG